MDEDLDEASSHIKSVYAHYGLAMYLAQCVEHGIVNALILAKLLPDEIARARSASSVSVPGFDERFDIFMDEHFELTMGALISRLRRTSALSSDFDIELANTRKLRNFLAHNFFRERAEEFISKAGRTAMLAELETAQKLFERVNNELGVAVRRLMPAVGLDLTKQEQLAADYLASVYARASARDGVDDASS